MKKKSFRVLSLLLAFILMLSTMSVATSAYTTDYNTPYTDENGKFYFTYEQAGSYVMDLIDELLSTVNNGKDIYLDIKISSYTLTLQRYDIALQSIYNFRKAGLINAAVSLGLAGDLNELNVDCLQSYSRRGDTSIPDYNCLYNLIHFLYDNRTPLQKIASSTFDWGLIDNFVDLPEMITNMSGWLSNFLFTTLEDLAGKEEGTATTATTYDTNGNDVDGSVNDLLLWLLNTKLAELLNFEGGLGLSLNDVDIKTVSFYDMINNIIRAALDNLVVPLLKNVLLDAFGIETSEEYPNGTPEDMTNQTMNIVLGVVENLLSEAETAPDYTNCTTPGEKIQTLLEWFFLEGGMNQYIIIDQNGLAIQDDLIELLHKLARLAINMLRGMGFGILPDELVHSNELNATNPETGEYIISDSQCIAILINMLFSKLIQGYYCNPNAKSVAEIGAYALASLCARICPEMNYMEQLEANYTDGQYIGIDGNVIPPLPFTSTYTVKGQIANGSGGWTPKDSTYTIPYAAVDMGVTVGVYFLDGLITADFSKVPAPGTDATERFEKFVKVLLDWVVDKYLPLFKTTYNLDIKYPDYTTVWKEIDEILFGLLPTSWLPSSITDHTIGNDYATQGQNGTATYSIQTSGDLICGWLIGSVMDVDLQELVSLFQRNTSSNAELNLPTLTVLLRLVDRILYIILGKYTILPNNQGSRNAYATATNLTSLNTTSNGLLNSTQLGNLVYYLVTALGGGTNTFNVQTKAVPILRTALPLIMSSTYVKLYRDNILSPAQISISDLEDLLDTIEEENSTINTEYMTSFNEETGKFAIGVYSGVGAINGVGTYNSSINGQDFVIYRNQEDFPNTLFTFNNYNDFIKDARKFIDEYNDFLVEMKDAADEWKEFLAENTDDKGPSSIYPWYSATLNYNSRVNQYGSTCHITNNNFNNLQVIQDFISQYGVSSFITDNEPLSILPSDKNASTTDKQTSIYKSWNKYVKEVIRMSNNLNNYYDGINYYLQTSESNRKPYTSVAIYSLRWVVYKLCADAYNNGINGYQDELGTLIPRYTENTWRIFKQAYEAAIALINQVNLGQNAYKTTQSLITAVRSGLITAYYGLIKAGELADKVALLNSIVLARRILAEPDLYDIYTTASINNLIEELANATELFEEVVEIDEQIRVDLQTARLQGAMNLTYILAPDLEIQNTYTGTIELGDKFEYANITKGYIYGLPTGDGVKYDDNVYKVIGIDKDKVTVKTTTYGNGTGTRISASNNSITKFEYYAVIFGDVNGDARIDGTDKTYIINYTLNTANAGNLNPSVYNGAYLMAADLDNDGTVTMTDALLIEKIVNYEGQINQARVVNGSRYVAY